MYKKYLKRFVDIFLVLLSSVIVLPIFFILALLVRLYLGSPILFKQLRPGWHGKPFVLYKFRTMDNLFDVHGNHLPDEQRLTKFGGFLRKFSLDELPELFNVLKGDMSLSGPRPLLMEYLSLYTPQQIRRHEVKPGITGWAQVNGRNELSWDKKFKLDIWYVDNYSFLLDLKILMLTIIKVLKKEGINQSENITMEKFSGE